MAERRNYWIKLHGSHFESDGDFDFLMSQKNGAEYIVLYQLLCLNTMNSKGELASQLGEVIIPYDVDKIVRDCKYFSRDTVVVALELYKKLGLIYSQEDGVLRITNHDEMVGSEAGSTKRVRAFRERQKQEALIEQKPLHCNADVTKAKRSCNTDIDIEKEIEKEKEIEERRGRKNGEKKKEENAALSFFPSESCNEASESPDCNASVFITMPVFGTDKNGNAKEAEITESFVAELEGLYQACDVRQSIRNAVGWCMAHPQNRKKDWKRFLIAWLQKDNDRARATPVNGYRSAHGPHDIDPTPFTGKERLDPL